MSIESTNHKIVTAEDTEFTQNYYDALLSFHYFQKSKERS
ncbi:hypothetical protein Mpsy_2385 [Methanolobus psychrophilus R15]|nr:hypothetical protein Mpsy_2385 [Methanolobus psychrophilus R15]